jgi:iron complex outermembrane recepter protein
MSELINTRTGRNDLRWKLLTTVSALALIGSLSATPAAKADDDTDRPTVWIELGGQLSRLGDGQEVFDPAFPGSPARPSIFSPSQKFEKPPSYSIDEIGKISFQPEDSNWVLAASVRYGRSVSRKSAHQQTYPKLFTKYFNGTYKSFAYPRAARFADTSVHDNEQHLILDFQAGKDVGLGMFGGRTGSSTVSLGVRFAQFTTKTNIAIRSDPDWHFSYTYLPTKLVSRQPYHSNYAKLEASSSFHGIGPSLSWNASMPFAGAPQRGELLLDWGLNAALLFGRQKTRVHHHTTELYQHGRAFYPLPKTVEYQNAPPSRISSRTVMVPNVGAFAGLTFKFPNVKVSAGYRADIFFGAMDGGIDTRKSENRGFYGPFMSVSIGMGG